ncbi:50S ribosomal protein L6 [Hahella ganghwensis]|uniref:50S ribosomal protein L6 n=1 Tax=Hahella ganghwensis TaxID=286420 RepID=UPI00036A6D4C|nr:50S ribosomal protein L6 [Hahella ganghwensis]
MSRVAKSPVQIPAGVEVKFDGQQVNVKGSKGALSIDVHSTVEVKQDGDQLTFEPKGGSKSAWAMAGTTRALINNMVKGVTDGFEKKLELIGVGYRAQAQGKALNLTLGFSHPVVYDLPEGITAETPSQTEIMIRGIDKQKVGQVAAEIRSIRPPEPYKGKGVRYGGEQVRVKEAKKK